MSKSQKWKRSINEKMTTTEALEVLKSNQCVCGNGKHFHNAFCRDCFYKLPTTIRRALYYRLGCGFEEAYELAVEALKEKGNQSLTPLQKLQLRLAHSFEFHDKNGE